MGGGRDRPPGASDKQPTSSMAEPGAHCLDRLRFVDGETFLVVCTFLPAQLCPGLAKIDMTDRSLYQVLREKYNLGRPLAANEPSKRYPTPLLLADGTANDLLCLLDYGGKMLSAFQAFGIDLVDLFRARRTSSKPAAS